MSTTELLYILVIAIFALGIAVFQYSYKAKMSLKKRLIFAFLRFCSLFLLGVLFLNPTFKQTSVTLEKPELIVAVDNSKSVALLHQDVHTRNFVKALKSSKLEERFSVSYLTFGESVNQLGDLLKFDDKQTRISNLFSTLKEVYDNEQSPTVILSDGNQTFGHDYVVSSLTYNKPIYPVVIGDSVLKEDLKISAVQLNKYTFLNNEFPIETTLSYVGENTINKLFSVFKDGLKVYSKSIRFSKDKNTHTVQFNLPALQIGQQNYRAEISSISSEENTANNLRNFSIEVIDERTNVLLISDVLHPDIGAYKKAIESNKQRKVTIAKPSDTIDFDNYQLVILFQPNEQFKTVFKQLETTGKNYLMTSGLQTNWDFLNTQNTNFKRTLLNQKQDYTSSLNLEFDMFQYEDINFTTFPPLTDFYGTSEYSENVKTLLYQTINGIETKEPMLSFFETGVKRHAIFLGEGIWRWRSQHYLNTQSFEGFDQFIGKIVQYLASNTTKERLMVTHENAYNLGEAIINADYVDKNYVIDPNASLSCKLVHKVSNKTYNYDFLFANTNYKLNLNHLPAGHYSYTIQVKQTNLLKKGNFIINDFDIEAQFINPDVTKLSQLATNSQNNLYTITESKQLISDIMADERYKPIQKETVSQLPLINWKYLLAVLLLLLTFEWLLRKYNGLL